MTLSMTGFGQAQNNVHGWKILVDIKSINHRALDVGMSIPVQSPKLEFLLHKLIEQNVGRGRIQLNIDIVRISEAGQSGFNISLFNERIAVLEKMFESIWSKEKIVEYCMQTPGIWTAPALSLIENQDLPLEDILHVAQSALDKLNAARTKEGAELRKAMLNFLDELDSSRELALKRAPCRLNEYKDKIYERFVYLQQELNVEMDPQRIAYEIALLADKADVNEEFVRIATHISALRILIGSKNDPVTCVGKKIDFYLQELHREATTVASKSRDTVLTKHSIDMRTVIESMREQAANIQ